MGEDWLSEGLNHIWLPYTQMKTVPAPIPVASAEGVRLTLSDGRELIDGVSSWWTAVHGYRHPHIEQAVRDQLERLPHVMLGGLAHEQAYRLSTRLAALLPGDLSRVFYSENGSVSVEIAMKMAVQYWLNKGERRTRFLSFKGGYHGDTFMTMSVCDPEEGMHSLFTGVVPEQLVINLPEDEASIAAFESALDRYGHETAAVVMEPLVQGAGGMVFHEAETLALIRKACDAHNVLLILDEIFTGFGRLGTLFACEQAGVVPDIITLSKALTGGTLPLAATVAREHVFNAFYTDNPADALMHGPTYMGNALACAAANASLDLFEREPRLDQVRAIEKRLAAGLEPAREIPGVVDVRTRGAIGVIQVKEMRTLDELKARFVAAGVWIRPFRDIIYTTPPYVIGQDDLDRLTTTLVEVTAAWSKDVGFA
ncbi:adenosylmethionine--8-amino-7-oxononanoate transaminase [bacterium AH-315-P15]|nr:adenosylmethionine--8-amino-7-oxononanoate transaminase [bacterium AH-315-P15]